MRVLVLTAFYPIPNVTHERMFVHVRNRYYQEHELNVTVLNFAAEENYQIDGIKVITQKEYERFPMNYNIIISHSANLRNHYRFLKKHEKEFEHLVFFFHGHEASIFAKDYPKPYHFTPNGRLNKRIIQYIYDRLKLYIWKPFYTKLANKSQFVFVSNYFFRRVQKNMGITPADFQYHCHVIHNSIGSFFENATYDMNSKKKYDYVAVRSNLDAPQYCVDLFVSIAYKNPNKKFLLIGKGEIFEYIEKPSNLVWINYTLGHEELLSYLNSAKCGLMLTRSDTQGVMTCEMASIGMPVISSDIEVCHEILSCFPNVALVPNDIKHVNVEELYRKIISGYPYPQCKKYFAEETIQKELLLFRSMMNS